MFRGLRVCEHAPLSRAQFGPVSPPSLQSSAPWSLCEVLYQHVAAHDIQIWFMEGHNHLPFPIHTRRYNCTHQHFPGAPRPDWSYNLFTFRRFWNKKQQTATWPWRIFRNAETTLSLRIAWTMQINLLAPQGSVDGYTDGGAHSRRKVQGQTVQYYAFKYLRLQTV